MSRNLTDLLYLVTIVTFILALRFLSSPRHARRGNQIGAAGMVLAVAVTLAQDGLEGYGLIALAMVIGAVVGAISARRVKMTAMPQMVALFNGVGGGAAALIALSEFHNLAPAPGRIGADETVSIVLSALIGSVSFAGSLVAFAKLQELVSGRPIVYPAQKLVNAAIILVVVALGVVLLAGPQSETLLVILLLGSLVFGVLFVLPIGGADMPVVISLLNACTGLAASATGFVLHNTVLIVSGALVGASGTLLTLLMGRAMNRSITNVLFGAFGTVQRRHRPQPSRTGDRCARRPPRTSRSCSPTRGAWSSFPATGSRSRRRSTTSARWRSCSRARASTSGTASIPWRVACPVT